MPFLESQTLSSLGRSLHAVNDNLKNGYRPSHLSVDLRLPFGE
jgi:hypothetical protein